MAQLQVEISGALAVLRFNGELAQSDAEALRQQMLQTVAPVPQGGLHLDFSGLTRAESGCVRLLLATARELCAGLPHARITVTGTE